MVVPQTYNLKVRQSVHLARHLFKRIVGEVQSQGWRQELVLANMPDVFTKWFEGWGPYVLQVHGPTTPVLALYAGHMPLSSSSERVIAPIALLTIGQQPLFHFRHTP